jgi:hypothetical protein
MGFYGPIFLPFTFEIGGAIDYFIRRFSLVAIPLFPVFVMDWEVTPTALTRLLLLWHRIYYYYFMLLAEPRALLLIAATF